MAIPVMENKSYGIFSGQARTYFPGFIIGDCPGVDPEPVLKPDALFEVLVFTFLKSHHQVPSLVEPTIHAQFFM